MSSFSSLIRAGVPSLAVMLLSGVAMPGLAFADMVEVRGTIANVLSGNRVKISVPKGANVKLQDKILIEMPDGEGETKRLSTNWIVKRVDGQVVLAGPDGDVSRKPVAGAVAIVLTEDEATNATSDETAGVVEKPAELTISDDKKLKVASEAVGAKVEVQPEAVNDVDKTGQKLKPSEETAPQADVAISAPATAEPVTENKTAEVEEAKPAPGNDAAQVTESEVGPSKAEPAVAEGSQKETVPPVPAPQSDLAASAKVKETDKLETTDAKAVEMEKASDAAIPKSAKIVEPVTALTGEAKSLEVAETDTEEAAPSLTPEEAKVSEVAEAKNEAAPELAKEQVVAAVSNETEDKQVIEAEPKKPDAMPTASIAKPGKSEEAATAGPVETQSSPMLLNQTADDSVLEPKLHDCDRFAAHPFDPDAVAEGVRYRDMVASKIVTACRKAIREFPSEARFYTQLTRGLHKDGDLEGAIEATRKGADLGSSHSMANLGVMHRQGVAGLEPDPAKALEWFEKAAEAGNPGGMVFAAAMHRDGKEVPQNYERAAELYLKASELGISEAHTNLAIFYDQGSGVKKHAAKSANHMLMAYRGGEKSATRILNDSPSVLSLPTRKALQLQLHRLGFYRGGIDGQLGAKSREALRRFVEARPAKSQKQARQ